MLVLQQSTFHSSRVADYSRGNQQTSHRRIAAIRDRKNDA
jgi:hypothetical protein